ncbi:MAG: YraN family protein [Spirochaetaceae bacterium]|jgi:putative endonuclease|nr:YraN family protein [Spirochaetaceae bacterium]
MPENRDLGAENSPKHRKIKGKEGEDKAEAFLKSSGFRIIGRNIRYAAGEIDIIALDRDVLVFVEVKAWSAYPIENLEYGISKKKQRRIIETSKYFLENHREYSDMPIRFDVVFIQADAVTHIASAFMENI